MLIHGSSIQKCGHGIYLASKEEEKSDKARYCGFCTPSLDSRLTQAEWDALVAKNDVLKRVFDATACPKCGSETHFVEGRHWVCSECKNEWKPPKHLRNSKALVSIRRTSC
jgi:hypothetical protein